MSLDKLGPKWLPLESNPDVSGIVLVRKSRLRFFTLCSHRKGNQQICKQHWCGY
jgi:hypothetical protein